MTSHAVKRLVRLFLALLLLQGLVACAPASRPEAYVVTGHAATDQETPPQCRHRHRPDRTLVTLQPPPGGWPGVPQAVVVMNVFQGEVEIRHDTRERCGTLQDARTLDSRFMSGMGMVLVPAKGDLSPIQVEFDPSPLPLWRPLVRLGQPATVQRQDTFRFSMRVASVAVMLALVMSSMLTFLSTRERAFLSYAVSSALFALWMALLSGLWAYPRPWLPLGEASLRLVVALPTALIGMTVRMLVHQSAPAALARPLRHAAKWLMWLLFALAATALFSPEAWIPAMSMLDEASFYALCLLLTLLASFIVWRGERGGITTVACVVPFVLLGVWELCAPQALAIWKVEAMMLCGCWLAITSSMSLTLRMGSLRRQRDEMRALAQTDALTGLHNRRAAMETLAEAVNQAQRQDHALTVGFLDIDHFKSINDRFGHETGDQVLQHFARALRTVFRDQDYVARMGGEEFLVLLPGVEPRHAAQRIQSLAPLLSGIAAALDRSDLHVTVSAGVAARRAGETDASALLQRADAAMYAAKHGGRDRVEVAP